MKDKIIKIEDICPEGYILDNASFVQLLKIMKWQILPMQFLKIFIMKYLKLMLI